MQGGIRHRYLLEHQIVWIEIDINGILPKSNMKRRKPVCKIIVRLDGECGVLPVFACLLPICALEDAH